MSWPLCCSISAYMSDVYMYVYAYTYIYIVVYTEITASKNPTPRGRKCFEENSGVS
jgi:hypothetical protein